MSKNKNPLKDLDLFLKQQASSLVSPTPLSDRVKQEEKTTEVQAKTEAPVISTIPSDLARQLDELSQSDKNKLYDTLIAMAEKQDGPENAMLINTILYMKHGDNWKDAVRDYWRNRY